MILLSSSYGNDSMAMIQWAVENINHEERIIVVYCDTGWASPTWGNRIIEGERLAKKCGMEVARVKSLGMEELVRMKKGFPGNGLQFCTAYLKGLPFLQFADEIDPECKAVVAIAKRRVESEARKDTPEFIEASEHHNGRKVWHPLYAHSDLDRDNLLIRAGIEKLGHRSLECNPCVNANRADFLRLTPGEIERVNNLEVEVGQPMFRAKRFNAMGIHGVIAWAKDGRNRGSVDDEESTCAGLFGCGL